MIAAAPGKLVLVGEYAVLEGAPALVMAVDRDAVVTLADTGVTSKTLKVSAPEIGIESVVLERPALAGPEALKLVLPRLAALPDTISHAHLDTSAFFLGPDKMGLGSSAALTVALERALDPFATFDEIFARARGEHLRFQGGAGSGIDLAASVHGGVLRYRLRGEELPERTELTWPADLSVIAVWSGKSADTRAFLQTLSRFAASEPSSYASLMAHLTALSARACDDFARGEVAAFLDDIDAYAAGLATLGQAAGLSIITPEHEHIGSIARSRGARYKPAGAGGGDLGIALCLREDAEAVSSALHEAECLIVPVGLAELGARLLD